MPHWRKFDMPPIYSPCQLPNRQTAVYAFIRHYALDFHEDPWLRLASLLQTFSRMPYENLSKVIKWNEQKNTSRSKRSPEEVILEHLRYGTGGTCFALTSALIYLLRGVGIKAEPILADRPYGQNTHCAVIAEINCEWYLVDPGFLVLEPVKLPLYSKIRLETGFNHILLDGSMDNNLIDLYTDWQSRCIYRLTYKTTPVDWGEFLSAWDASFYWDMMRYPLLTKITGDEQIYMRDNRLQSRSKKLVQSQNIKKENIIEGISRHFGIHEDIVLKAMAIFQKEK